MGVTKKRVKKSEEQQAPKSSALSSKYDNAEVASEAPTLARRKMNRDSTIRLGRTIGEKREKLETRNERIAARKKDKKKAARRVTFTSVAFIILGVGVVYLGHLFFSYSWSEPAVQDAVEVEVARPTIEVVDEDAQAAGGKITSRMLEYISQVENDLHDLGYTPVKAVIPAGAIREVDFYLDGYAGFIKMTIDRDAAVSAEDTDRMIRYLGSVGVSDFQYIDVRVDRRAYWK